MQPPLKRIHPDTTYASDPVARASLGYWRTRPTEEILNSLRAGPEALKVKLDGRMMNGNTRTKVLEERGIEIDSLPREIIEDYLLGDPFIDSD